MGADGRLSACLLQVGDERHPAVTTPEADLASVHTVSTSAKTLKEVEKQTIVEALSECGGNIQKTAARLGIGRNTLYRKIEEYELTPPEMQRRSGTTECKKRAPALKEPQPVS
jgi:DNA-binding NtrC family response regulator